MTKLNKVLAVVLSLFVIVSVCSMLSGCSPDKEEEKYDVAIMLARVETTPGGYLKNRAYLEKRLVGANELEIDIEQEYDGKYYAYCVCAFNFPEYPAVSDVWFPYQDYLERTVPNEHKLFSCSLYDYVPDVEHGGKYTVAVCDPGKYSFTVYVASSKGYPLCKAKTIEVRITVS